MALTLTEGNKYSTTSLQGYVIDRLAKLDPVLEVLPFEDLMGNSLTYDTIVTRSGAAFYAVGDTWVESTPSMSQNTVTLKILGGDADIDNFLLATRSNQLDLKGTVLDDKIRAVREEFMETFYYGSATTDTKEFNGLHKLISSTTYNTVHAGATAGTDLSIKKVQQVIDLITGYTPTFICMSKGMRRYITAYLDSVGAAFSDVRDNFGNVIQYYRGLRVVASDYIKDTETTASGAYSSTVSSDTTSIFVLSFASKACCGVQGSAGIVTEPLGSLETKDASRYRIKWYCGLKFEDLRSCAKVDGIHATGTVVV